MYNRGVCSEITYLRKLIKTVNYKKSQANKYITSDESSEDKGFSPFHKQTKGGELAYENGEMPKTYFTKKVMLLEVERGMKELENSWKNGGGSLQNLIPKPIQILTFIFSNPISSTINTLNKKYSKQELFNIFFKHSGVHYTGSYYRYTKFYKCINGEELLYTLINILHNPNPITYEQTQIQF